MFSVASRRARGSCLVRLQGFGERHFSGGEQAERGQSFWGNWKDDEQEGEGKLKTSEGTSYEGQWKGGAFHGQGTYVFQQSKYTGGASSTYTGQWTEGKKDGKGKLTQYSGNSYDGDWKADKRHGARLRARSPLLWRWGREADVPDVPGG